MDETKDILAKIESILGARIAEDGTLNIHYDYSCYTEARNVLHQVRSNQKELRALKREINQICKEIRAEYASKRTMVGKGVGAGLATAFLGRKTVGGFNSIKRDGLRDEKDAALVPYENLKLTIDNIIHQLDDVKHNVEMSEEYADKPSKSRARRPNTKQANQIRRKEDRFYAFMDDEVQGPFDLNEIGALVKAAAIGADTQLCVEGEHDWHPMSHFFDV